MTQIGPKGSRPEALAKFAEVARHDDGQPVREGVEATRETAAIPTNPKLKQDAANQRVARRRSAPQSGRQESHQEIARPDREKW